MITLWIRIAEGAAVTEDERYLEILAVEVETSEGVAVLVLRGELDVAAQSRFVEALASAEGGCARVVLDLAELTFINAPGTESRPIVLPLPSRACERVAC